MAPLHVEYGTKALQNFIFLHEKGQLNLEPGFQRKSVWTVRDREKLMESICTHRPIPSIFLCKSTDDRGRLKYDVIDGKQRLESVLLFQGAKGFRGARFEVNIQLERDAEPSWYDWTSLKRRGQEHLVMGYKVQIVEVTGDLSDVIDLFVRINSTGKRLTGAEKRHAKYYHSPFLRRAGQLAELRRTYFRTTHVMSEVQVSRMKHVELVAELLASIIGGGPINKKSALDKIIGGQYITPRALVKAGQAFTTTANRVAKMFPRLKETRLRNSAELYSLFMVIWKLGESGAILTDARRNRQGWV